MDAYVFSADRYPLLTLETHGKGVDDAGFARYLAELTEHNVRAGRDDDYIALLIDTTEATRGASATQRRMQADWFHDHQQLLRDHTAAVALVITSPMVRGILTAILWLRPMPAPLKVFPNRAEAETWCLNQIRGRETQDLAAAR